MDLVDMYAPQMGRMAAFCARLGFSMDTIRPTGLEMWTAKSAKKAHLVKEHLRTGSPAVEVVRWDDVADRLCNLCRSTHFWELWDKFKASYAGLKSFRQSLSALYDVELGEVFIPHEIVGARLPDVELTDEVLLARIDAAEALRLQIASGPLRWMNYRDVPMSTLSEKWHDAVEALTQTEPYWQMRIALTVPKTNGKAPIYAHDPLLMDRVEPREPGHMGLVLVKESYASGGLSHYGVKVAKMLRLVHPDAFATGQLAPASRERFSFSDVEGLRAVGSIYDAIPDLGEERLDLSGRWSAACATAVPVDN